MTSEALVPIVEESPRVELGVIRADRPAQLVALATEAANALADVVESRKLYSMIQGKKFVKCEGWTTLAAMLGVTPHEIATVEQDGIFTATVELRRLTDGSPVARASAECGAPDELDRQGKPLWSARPRYARRSMALTRATAKACRLAFSWIMVLAGFQPTPEEEIPQQERGGHAPKAGDSPPAPTSPQRITEADEFPTRDTPWPGEGKLQGKTVREWALNQLRAAESGEVKVPDEWLSIVKLELRARAAKAAS